MLFVQWEAHCPLNSAGHLQAHCPIDYRLKSPSLSRTLRFLSTFFTPSTDLPQCFTQFQYLRSRSQQREKPTTHTTSRIKKTCAKHCVDDSRHGLRFHDPPSDRFLAPCAALRRHLLRSSAIHQLTGFFLHSSTRDTGHGLFTRRRDESHSCCDQIFSASMMTKLFVQTFQRRGRGAELLSGFTCSERNLNYDLVVDGGIVLTDVSVDDSKMSGVISPFPGRLKVETPPLLRIMGSRPGSHFQDVTASRVYLEEPNSTALALKSPQRCPPSVMFLISSSRLDFWSACLYTPQRLDLAECRNWLPNTGHQTQRRCMYLVALATTLLADTALDGTAAAIGFMNFCHISGTQVGAESGLTHDGFSANDRKIAGTGLPALPSDNVPQHIGVGLTFYGMIKRVFRKFLILPYASLIFRLLRRAFLPGLPPDDLEPETRSLCPHLLVLPSSFCLPHTRQYKSDSRHNINYYNTNKPHILDEKQIKSKEITVRAS
ncbi:hypothetical protein J6590_093819 [Homalodisca vitripennis]|nr:hypothetical protein J6590_093819 [Homalodisca vitripennis]